jgi:hypothetical protein
VRRDARLFRRFDDVDARAVRAFERQPCGDGANHRADADLLHVVFGVSERIAERAAGFLQIGAGGSREREDQLQFPFRNLFQSVHLSTSNG